LFHKGVEISAEQPLLDAGFDSIAAEEFVARLQARLREAGWEGAAGAVDSTAVFDCPTASLIARRIDRELVGEGGEGQGQGGGVGGRRGEGKGEGEGGEEEPLAVVGMACRFPGVCNSPEAFWDLLCSGSDTSTEVPPGR
ncbi:unnamed protein product, partial [Discosporangium mesarthrocarpum]